MCDESVKNHFFYSDPLRIPTISWATTMKVEANLQSARQGRIHVSTGSARTRLRYGSQHAPLMLVRRACALEAGGFGDL